MRIYKVTLRKIAFVRAKNKTEAEELACDDECMMSVEEVVTVKQSNREELRDVMFSDAE